MGRNNFNIKRRLGQEEVLRKKGNDNKANKKIEKV